MRRIEDPRVAFYLRHRAEIDEWASVKDDVHVLAHEFFESLLPGVRAAAPEGVDVSLLGDRWSRIAMSRPAWRPLYVPTVEVVFEWKRSTADFASGRRRIGVRVGRAEAGGPETVDELTRKLSEVREPAFPMHDGYWPAFRQEPPPNGAWWDDLEPYEQQITRSLLEAWDLLSPTLDS